MRAQPVGAMVRLFKHYIPHAVLLLGLVDFGLLLLAGDLAWQLRAWQVDMDPGELLYRLPLLLAFAVVTQVALIAVGVFGADALRSMRFAGARLLVGVSLAILSFALIAYVLHGHTFWRSTLFFAMMLAIALLMANRLLVGGILGASAFRRRVLVLGAGKRARRIRTLAERPESGFCVAGYIAMNAGQGTIEQAVPRGAIAD